MGKMYPRVKVRVESEKAACQEDTKVLLLRVIQSRSAESNSSTRLPVKVSGSRSLQARTTTKSPNPHQSVPSVIKASKDSSSGKIAKHADDNDRPNIRASSVPRPRAVLSSPDNDELIGSMNRRSIERHTIKKSESPRRGTTASAVEHKPAARSVSTGRAAGRSKTGMPDTIGSSNHKEAKQISGLKTPTPRFHGRKDKMRAL